MKQIVAVIVFVLFAIAARSQGIVVSTAFNTNSTEGDYFGTWSFSFSTNDFTPAGGGQSPRVGQWGVVSSSMSFTDAVSGAVISVSFTVGGIESPNEFGFRSSINVDDPALGTVFGGIGDSGGGGYQESTTLVYPGSPASLTNFNSQDIFHFYSPQQGMGGQGQVDRIDNLIFNGVYGAGGGTWAISYPVPEPATVWEIGIGAIGLCVARFSRFRRW